MANAVEFNGFQIQSAPAGASFFEKLVADYKQYRLFRRTVAELRGLTNRELSDLGLSRSGIIATAREAVYGI